jgi:hypothetical protein
MDGKINVVKKNKFQVSKWSGGTTTELLIYPENAKYSDRNFTWRLSSAKVEVDESVFTHLPGISRIIMIVDGQLSLEHEGHHKIVLNPFEQDAFMGDWHTKSFGMVTDFNLMMNEGCKGRLQALSFKNGDSVKIPLNEASEGAKQVTDVFYGVAGNFELIIQDNMYNVNQGEVLSVTRLINEKDYELNIYNKGNKEGKIIRSTIFYHGE